MVSPDTGYGDLEAITEKTESAFYHKHTLQFVSRIRDDTHWKKKIKTHCQSREVSSRKCLSAAHGNTASDCTLCSFHGELGTQSCVGSPAF